MRGKQFIRAIGLAVAGFVAGAGGAHAQVTEAEVGVNPTVEQRGNCRSQLRGAARHDRGRTAGLWDIRGCRQLKRRRLMIEGLALLLQAVEKEGMMDKMAERAIAAVFAGRGARVRITYGAASGWQARGVGRWGVRDALVRGRLLRLSLAA